MSNNIEVRYNKNPKFVLKSSENLYLPSLGFNREEDAELAISIAKAMNVRNKRLAELPSIIKYVFRLLDFADSPWTKQLNTTPINPERGV